MVKTAILGLVCASLLPFTAAQAVLLESPAQGAIVSGLGFISGWKCNAKKITVQVGGFTHRPVAMGQPRADTRRACGTENNGFILQYNWNLLGDGTHFVRAYDDGVEFARATFRIGTTGEEWLEDVEAEVVVPDFPAPGENGRFVWNESTQHLELVEAGSYVQVPDSPSETPSFFGTWTLWSNLTANCQPPTQGEGVLYVHGGDVSGWFRQNETVRSAHGVYRKNNRYDLDGYITAAGAAEWDLRYEFSGQRKYAGTFQGTFRDEHYGSGTWHDTAGCRGIWRATK